MSRAVLALLITLSGLVVFAQQPPDVKNATEADHRNMMEQLGITALRPGPSGNESAPNHANTDEALANPYPDLPDPLRLKNGKKVTTEKHWWTKRRPEIVEDFEREVIGRVPKSVPKVAWSVTDSAEWVAGTNAVKGRQLVGHVDNSAYPAVSVEIQMTVVTPAASSSARLEGCSKRATPQTSLSLARCKASGRPIEPDAPVTRIFSPAIMPGCFDPPE